MSETKWIIFHNKKNNTSDHTIASIDNDDKIINIDTMGFTGSQIILSDSTFKIMDAYGCRNNVAFIDQFDANGVSVYL